MKAVVVNIGNTNIRFGIFKEGICHTSWIINTKPYRTQDELFSKFKVLYQTYKVEVDNVDQILVGSVVPQLTDIVGRALRDIHGISPVVVDRSTPSRVKHPSGEMGTDIYANLVAADILYNKKKIIVDFGTALTVSCIDEDAQVLGVIIAPGVITSLNGLVNQTAQLPEIELSKPESVLGQDTISCMRSGIVYGYLGMVEGFIDRINAEVKDDCYVIATGGLSPIYQPLSDKIHTADLLHTLKGLYFLGLSV